MFEENGIVYADNRAATLKIIDIIFLDDWRIDARFNNGERRTTDFSPLLSTPAFAPLANQAAFKSGKLEFGTVTWNNGTIDIAPEWVYDHGE